MIDRSTQELERELGAIQFLLAEAPSWDAVKVPLSARRHIEAQYRRRERLLLSVLQRAAPHAAAVSALAAVPSEPIPEPKLPIAEPPPTPVAEVISLASAREDAVAAVAAPAPLPAAPMDALFDPPLAPSREQRVVEEVSTWNKLWKPFLYESALWFIGAFLIVVGAYFFIAESWAGMSSTMRSLVVFGVAGAYSAGFSAWGRIVGRKSALSGASRVLRTIAAAIAPLASLAMRPLALGEHPWVIGLVGLWVLACIALAKDASRANGFEDSSLVALVALSTGMLALAPAAAVLGAPMLWLNVIAVALAARARPAASIEGPSRWFAPIVAAYLVTLFTLPLHIALVERGASIPLSAYSPLVGLAAAASLSWRLSEPLDVADPISIAVVSVQVAALALSTQAPAPGFFVTAAIATTTAVWLARGTAGRARWSYVTYAAAYFAYQSVGQLIPDALRHLLEELKHRLGYAPAAQLPFNYDAVYAVPFVLAGALWAFRPDERTFRGRELRKVLLRSTAIASGILALLAFAGSDFRPALWSLPPLVVVCLVAGVRSKRRELQWTGAALSVLVPLAAMKVLGFESAALLAGAGVVLLSALSRANGDDSILALAALAQSLCCAANSWTHPSILSAAALALSAAGLRIAASRPRAVQMWIGTLALSVAPIWVQSIAPVSAPLALAAGALVLGVVGQRVEGWKSLAWPSFVAALVSGGWISALGVSTGAMIGPTLLLASMAALACSAELPFAGVVAAVLLGGAAIPSRDGWHSWPGIAPRVLLLMNGAIVVCASAWSIAKKRSAASAAFALVSIVCAGISASAVVHSGPLEWALLAATLIASTAALVSWFTLPLATALLFGMNVGMEPPALWWLPAVAMLTLALLDELPDVRRLVLGDARVAPAAGLSAIAAMFGSAIWIETASPVAWIAMAALAPILVVRTSRDPRFAIFAAPLLLLGWRMLPGVHSAWPIPIWLGAISAATWNVDRVARIWLGGNDRKTRVELGRWLWLGAVGTLVFSVALPLSLEMHAAVLPLSIAVLAIFGGPIEWRLSFAALGLCVVPEARWFGASGLLALAAFSHHRPAWMQRLLGGEISKRTVRIAALDSLLLTLVALGVAIALGEPLQMAAPLGALLIALAAFFVSQRWIPGLLPVALGLVLAPRWEASLAVSTIAGALAQLLFRSSRLQQRGRELAARLSPELEGEWSQPLWTAGALGAACFLALHTMGLVHAPVPLLGAAALLLLVTPHAAELLFAAGLVGASAALVVPIPWAAASVALIGATLCTAGWMLERRVASAKWMHHAGWMLALASLVFIHHLGHPATPIALGAIGLATWLVAVRRPSTEPLAWLASAIALHGAVLHLGVVFSTDKPAAFVLPYLAFVSALCACVASVFPTSPRRRRSMLGLASLALLEAVGALALIRTHAPREGFVAALALVLVFASLVRATVRSDDEASAHLAQASLVAAYASVHWLLLGSGQTTSADSLAALVGGALFSGFHLWARRQGASLKAFVRPSRWGAFALPLIGLVSAPWSDPWMVSALLVGHAAHFAAVSSQHKSRAASLLSFAAFNGALVLCWLASNIRTPQYLVIPAALSALVLLRVFRGRISELAEARLRAVTITALYAASAWEPLVFGTTWAMLVCVLLCVLGVMAGIALRIRSFIYLGSAFLVTAVAANLIRYGARDHRLGALFLSLLGLSVIASMVLLTARRAELMKRYDQLRHLMQEWSA